MSTRGESAPNPFARRIMVLVDGDPPSSTAVDRAAALATALDAELLLLGIMSVFGAHPTPSALAMGAGELATQRDSIEAQTVERLCEARDRIDPGVRSRTVVGWSPTGPAIVNAVREEDADLIVLPMRRGDELTHLLHDGADRHVLHHSPVPVLVVPEI
jgi:nucleotide-binding universal stress UspA family protein